MGELDFHNNVRTGSVNELRVVWKLFPVIMTHHRRDTRSLIGVRTVTVQLMRVILLEVWPCILF